MAPENEERAKQAILGRFLAPGAGWPIPLPSAIPPDRLRDRYRGCLLWGAAGDALGRAVEGQAPAAIRARYGEGGLSEYVPWRGWRSGPKGAITDDTQLTMEVARTLIAAPDQFAAADFARRLIAWLPVGRGRGQATTEAVTALTNGQPWWVAGVAVDSAGNGAAMRAAPVGLARALDPTPEALRRDAVLSAFVTHTHPVGVAGAVAIAAGVAYCIRAALAGEGALDPRGFLAFVTGTLAGIEPAPTMERRPGGHPVRLGERIAELADLLGRPPDEVFALTHNGAFALESVPAALYCFLRSPDDPRAVILTAVNGGHDADTVASMAGNLAGAWCGAERLRLEAPSWWSELEYRDELIALADDLAALTSRR